MTFEGETLQRPGGSSPSGPRFVPGTVLGDRYRIVSLLGRGGMGEVYRADDLKLGSPVALKFLPPAAAADPQWLDRFLGEVRIARGISHPNVCRVYDVGETAGQHFLSMELIEGEDLASLLRRIGRLPEEKALEIARQLCAGLAAAHDHGVVHRDLKPANVMIDDRGRARITDFGLARFATELTALSAWEGTPAYQSPEQLEGREVTVRSDIYALGLLLYELFTGRRPFTAESREELLRLQMQSRPPTPTSLIDKLDPLLERAILACLHPEPEKRPASALRVSAMLPGGDPLQAALAAGETPSPDVVAAAAAEGSISPVAGSAGVAAVIALVAVILFLGGRTQLHRQIPLPLSAQQLSLRAEQVLSLAGVDIAGHQRTYGWAYDDAFRRKMRARPRTAGEWDVFRRDMITGTSPPILFWHQTGAQLDFTNQLRAIPRDIPLKRPGDTLVTLDPQGRIRELEIIPAPVAQSAGSEVDWRPLLAQTAARPETLAAHSPRWRSPVFADRLYAWSSGAINIEASSAGGRPVWMAVLGPEEVPFHATRVETPLTEQAFLWLLVGFYVIAMVTGAILAWRNARSGRGDRRGAFRIAAIVFATSLLSWIVGGLHVASVHEIALFLQALMEAVFSGSLVWVLYIALEPIIRRVWPQRLISWNRVLVGSWRDPMVGRDVLAGTIAGLILTAGNLGAGLMSARALGASFDAQQIMPFTLEGIRGVLFTMLNVTTRGSVVVPFASLTFIVLIGLVVRRMSIAAFAFFLLFTLALSLDAPTEPLVWVVTAVSTAAFTLALVRFGLLAAVVAHFVFFFTTFYPITPDFSAWFFPVSCLLLLLVGALAVYGFVTSIGPRQAWLSEEALR
jgi:hypothetical protein